MAAWLCSNGAKAKLVRIVHPGGHVELHDGPVRAAEIMLRNPKFCVTHSQASCEPWAIVSPDTTLMVGRKYYLFQESTVGKVQKRPATGKENGDWNCACFGGGNCAVEGIKSRKENESGERTMGTEISCRGSDLSSEGIGKKVKRRAVFLENGNIPNKQFGSDDQWEPSLNSITEEVS